jgi:hypothetical protein
MLVGSPPFSSWASLQKAVEVLANFHNGEFIETRDFQEDCLRFGTCSNGFKETTVGMSSKSDGGILSAY